MSTVKEMIDSLQGELSPEERAVKSLMLTRLSTIKFNLHRIIAELDCLTQASFDARAIPHYRDYLYRGE